MPVRRQFILHRTALGCRRLGGGKATVVARLNCLIALLVSAQFLQSSTFHKPGVALLGVRLIRLCTIFLAH